jgi:hypothetical protein
LSPKLILVLLFSPFAFLPCDRNIWHVIACYNDIRLASFEGFFQGDLPQFYSSDNRIYRIISAWIKNELT